ncbi:MAG TPA: patatin-like phospholipase family protein [Usitatibacteraceae bacterium]
MATRKPSKSKPAAVRSKPAGVKRINLALQGGGSHGAFTWGVIDQLLADGRIDIEGISGTSAGSMNAVVYAYGYFSGGPDGARAALERFWKAVSVSADRYSPLHAAPWERLTKSRSDDNAFAFEAFKIITNAFSPYQLNPLNFNPLLNILNEQIDFKALNTCRRTKLFLSATNVHTGKVRVFNTHEVTAQSVMASACLPQLFQAVEIDGEPYWDGGYMGNPALFPLFYETEARDVLIVHINPIERQGTPTTPAEIYNRVNEISFNSSLIKEFRAIAFVQKMHDEGWLKPEFRDKMKYVLIHSLRADKVLADLSIASKFSSDWDFLLELRERGRTAAADWLKRHFNDLGVRATVDLRAEFLTSGSELANAQPDTASVRTSTKRAKRS